MLLSLLTITDRADSIHGGGVIWIIWSLSALCPKSTKAQQRARSNVSKENSYLLKALLQNLNGLTTESKQYSKLLQIPQALLESAGS